MRVVIAQMVVSLIASLIWWLCSSHPGHAALSALAGGAICWVPSAMFALRLKSRGAQGSAMGLVVGEAVKMGLTLAMFVAIAVGYPGVLWLPLLVTYLVALKTYWLALALH
jgi:ATP synthase protein I